MSVTSKIRGVLGAVRRVPPSVVRPGHWSMALGTLLVAASTVGVMATTNTRPEITHLRMVNSAIEGETVTLVGALSDPDDGDRHSVKIYWLGDNDYVTQPGRQKILLDPGQTTFQVSHVYKDDLPSTPVKVMVIDRQLPDGSNDNSSGGITVDFEIRQIEVRNVAPKFVEGSVSVQKVDRARVIVEGKLADPGIDDKISVEAAWGDPRTTAPSACTMSDNDRQFRCEHSYPSIFGLSRTYNIGLRAIDDDGGMANHQTSVRVP